MYGNRNILPTRKPLRLKGYDYSSNGCYFVTICVKDKKHILSYIKNVSNARVGTGLCARPKKDFILTPIGVEVAKSIQYINDNYYNRVKVNNYCIMPNHIHLLIVINNIESADGHRDPSLRDVIRNLKSYTTNKYNQIENNKFSLWQDSYYDHIIRNDEDYAEKYRYIDTNPSKWLDDEYFINDNVKHKGEF